jgi:hypothetical protein
MPCLSSDCIHAHFDRFRSPFGVVRVPKSHALKQSSRIVMSYPMSGDNHRQVQCVKSVREHCAQSLLAQPQTPGRPHEVDTGLYLSGIHLPLPQPGTPRELACLTKKHWPVLEPETALTLTFCVKPVMCLIPGHGAAEVVRHLWVTPQGFGKPGIFVSPASKSQATRRRRRHSRPFVDGSISPSCLSRLHATRSARANALKMASIL